MVTIVFSSSSTMISGAHTTLFSKNPVADRAFFKEVLKIPCADAGCGWLIVELSTLTMGFSERDCGGADLDTADKKK